MTLDKSISIPVNANELEKFCQLLIKRSRDIAKTHDALITLETFITTFGKASHGTDEYNEIEQRIKSLTEQTRQQLMLEKTIELEQALKACDLAGLSAIHTPFSRNGFYLILQDAVNKLSAEEINTATHWSSDWVTDAKTRAEQASGYPDSLDFKTAGISIEDYQTLVDISHFLTHL